MVKKHQLSNGLTVILSPLRDTKAVTVLALVRVGSRYETADINGVSHFLEHLLFKGTQKRPTTLDISTELDRLGASYNAFTGKDHTGYYIKASHTYVALALDVISDMLFHSVFDVEELNRERGVIVEELNMYDDNPLMHIDEMLEESLYGKKTPLGQLIGGPRSVIKKVPREKIIRYWRKYYQPGNMVVVVSGKFQEDAMMKMVRKYFGQSGKKKVTRAHFRTQPPVTLNLKTSLQKRPTEQTQLAIAFPAFGYGHADLPAVKVMNTILGSSMSSRLFVEVREKRGLAYSVRSSVDVYERFGHVAISAGVDRRRLEDSVEAIVRELERLKHEPITEQELNDAKTQIHGRVDLAFEDSEKIAAWYGTQYILTEKMLTPEQSLKQVSSVTIADIQRLAQKIFVHKRAAIALIGQHETQEVTSIKKLLRQLS